MKTSLKFLLLFSCVLVLSACTNPFKKTEVVQDQERTYSCGDLKNETSKQNCFENVKNIALEELNNEIVRTFDMKRCVELPQDMADSCVNMIKESGVTGPVSDEEITALREAMNLVYKTTQGPEGEVIAEEEGYYDIAKCASLIAPGLKEYCEKRLNMQMEQEKMFQIVESGEVAKCDELKEESLKKSCKSELGVAVEEPENTGAEMIEETTEPTEATEPVPAEPTANEPVPEVVQP